MATPNYSLPTVTGTDTFSSVEYLNSFALAVDAALKDVADDGGAAGAIPAATPGAIGGILSAGDITVASNGTPTVANGAITSTKLDASVQTSITSASTNAQNALTTAQAAQSAASSANSLLSAAPKLTNLPGFSGATGRVTAGSAEGTYVVNEAAHLVTVKVVLTGVTINATGGNTNPASPAAQLGMIPSRYKPSMTIQNLCTVGQYGGGLAQFNIGVSGTDGAVYLSHTFGGEPSGNLDGIYGECIIAYMYGAS